METPDYRPSGGSAERVATELRHRGFELEVAVFHLTPAQLVELTAGTVAAVKG
jgi:hypothetical protein